MREPDKDPGRLSHMLEMAKKLTNEKNKHTVEDLNSNTILFFGLVKMLEIIGEAAYKLTKEFKNTHNDLPWNSIEGMRHVLVHGYYKILPHRLLETINSDIPVMIPVLEKYLKEFENTDK